MPQSVKPIREVDKKYGKFVFYHPVSLITAL